jgi:uncharacterized protein
MELSSRIRNINNHNDRELLGSVIATFVIASASILSLLLFVYLLLPNDYSGCCYNAYAQQYTTATTAHNSVVTFPLFQNTTNNNTTTINNSSSSILSTSGTATAKVKPDKVTIILGVETTNKTAKASLSTNSATMSKVLNVLLASGVKQNETSTSTFGISPNYNYSQGRNTITGFTTANSIQIQSSNINSTAKWIDTAVSSGGATTINSIDFTLSDKKLEEIKNGLIKQAINDARNKANIAVSALGLKVLGVKSVSVNEAAQAPPPLPQPFLQKQQLATAAPTPASNPTPIISGQQEVSVSASIGWLIG